MSQENTMRSCAVCGVTASTGLRTEPTFSHEVERYRCERCYSCLGWKDPQCEICHRPQPDVLRRYVEVQGELLRTRCAVCWVKYGWNAPPSACEVCNVKLSDTQPGSFNHTTGQERCALCHSLYGWDRPRCEVCGRRPPLSQRDVRRLWGQARGVHVRCSACAARNIHARRPPRDHAHMESTEVSPTQPTDPHAYVQQAKPSYPQYSPDQLAQLEQHTRRILAREASQLIRNKEVATPAWVEELRKLDPFAVATAERMVGEWLAQRRQAQRRPEAQPPRVTRCQQGCCHFVEQPGRGGSVSKPGARDRADRYALEWWEEITGEPHQSQALQQLTAEDSWHLQWVSADCCKDHASMVCKCTRDGRQCGACARVQQTSKYHADMAQALGCFKAGGPASAMPAWYGVHGDSDVCGYSGGSKVCARGHVCMGGCRTSNSHASMVWGARWDGGLDASMGAAGQRSCGAECMVWHGGGSRRVIFGTFRFLLFVTASPMPRPCAHGCDMDHTAAADEAPPRYGHSPLRSWWQLELFKRRWSEIHKGPAPWWPTDWLYLWNPHTERLSGTAGCSSTTEREHHAHMTQPVQCVTASRLPLLLAQPQPWPSLVRCDRRHTELLWTPRRAHVTCVTLAQRGVGNFYPPPPNRCAAPTRPTPPYRMVPPCHMVHTITGASCNMVLPSAAPAPCNMAPTPFTQPCRMISSHPHAISVPYRMVYPYAPCSMVLWLSPAAPPLREPPRPPKPPRPTIEPIPCPSLLVADYAAIERRLLAHLAAVPVVEPHRHWSCGEASGKNLVQPPAPDTDKEQADE